MGYVDGLLHVSTLDRAVVMTERSAKDKTHLDALRELLSQSRISTVSYKSMVRVFSSSRGEHALRVLGFDLFVAKAMFRLLDTDDRSVVDIEEFMNCLMCVVSGNATSMHQATLHYQNKRLLLLLPAAAAAAAASPTTKTIGA